MEEDGRIDVNANLRKIMTSLLSSSLASDVSSNLSLALVVAEGQPCKLCIIPVEIDSNTVVRVYYLISLLIILFLIVRTIVSKGGGVIVGGHCVDKAHYNL